MGLTLAYEEGQTPLDQNEIDGLLIPTVATRGELDEFEQLNIQKAVEWTLRKKFPAEVVFTEKFIRDLHKRMYEDVWAWAGSFRKSNKNLGVDWHRISIELRTLLDDAMYWLANDTYPPHEIAIRFKHRIVSIHCFSNGNGRHSRLLADVISKHIFGEHVYSWGGSGLVKANNIRSEYLAAVRQADAGAIERLMTFAKS